MKKIHTEHGAASIPFVLGISALVFVIAISITSIELSRAYLTQAIVSGMQAREFAEVGLRDALFKIARDATFAVPSPSFYTIEMATSGCVTLTACVRVSVGSSTATTSEPKVITSIGYFKAGRIGLSADVVYDVKGRGGISVTRVTKF